MQLFGAVLAFKQNFPEAKENLMQLGNYTPYITEVRTLLLLLCSER